MTNRAKTTSPRPPGLILILGLILAGCAGLRYQPPSGEPVLRVGLAQDVETIFFEIDGALQVLAADGKESFSSSEKGTWSVSVSDAAPGIVRFHPILYESTDRDKATQAAVEWRDKGIPVELRPRGEALYAGSRLLVDHRVYSVVNNQEFETAAAAEACMKTDFPAAGRRVFREMRKPASGKLVMISPSKKSHVVHPVIRLTGSEITLPAIPVGEGFHFAHQERRTFSGEIEIALLPDGLLSLVNVVPMDLYLRGVVAGEMGATFPAEALKAQAIVSRTIFLRNFGLSHRDDDFDICDDVHCQAYVGLRKSDGAAAEAVNATKGLVLTEDDELCTASYAAVCGGHTENASDAWDSEGETYLRGRFDTVVPVRGFDLSQEDKALLWIDSRPNVCCNLEKISNPEFARYAEKYFRWQQRISRAELEKNIREKTGRPVGLLLDIIPLRRSASGRIAELQIAGSEDTVIVRKELNIRRALSSSALYSACFYVEKRMSPDGLPEEFIFRGAGWGHGVGMCQVGAAARAHQGKTVSEILSFYYPGTQIKQIY